MHTTIFDRLKNKPTWTIVAVVGTAIGLLILERSVANNNPDEQEDTAATVPGQAPIESLPVPPRANEAPEEWEAVQNWWGDTPSYDRVVMCTEISGDGDTGTLANMSWAATVEDHWRDGLDDYTQAEPLSLLPVGGFLRFLCQSEGSD
ncbi:hypothetical protein [Nocardiopsis aegyptia]|uniref:Uncharacterized protein n=1 Tax=Nocardiopsis aegyptia TaxID=220378 RepID=A0A7Z0EJ35_9ACTN|nr:hypothetical protein [Nocardiopsis aegyptia]NYJ32814.1 hypothetical protein [Nocardiopsis aegyptia]